ncbi:glycosyltransferase family 2 protein [soil metagenome]
MKVSLCITVFNEEKSIERLLESLEKQTRKADEIIIVDAGSTDKTIEIIKKYSEVKLTISKRASISKGRNIAITKAKYEIIVMTDAGCICDKNWIKNITKPFDKKETDVVAGFYNMAGNTNFQKALKPFLGIMPEKFDQNNFLPSTRSIAFRKKVWEKVNGFDKRFDKAGEDTDFNIKILKNNFKVVRVKNALVDWEVPNNLISAMKKFYYYARGDAQSKRISKHNIKVLTIFGRYFLFIIFWPIIIVYLIYAYWKAGLWGTIIQVSSDFAIMAGFTNGIF